MKSIDFMSSLEMAVFELEKWPSWKSEALMDVFGGVVRASSFPGLVSGFSLQCDRVAPERKSMVGFDCQKLVFFRSGGGAVCCGEF